MTDFVHSTDIDIRFRDTDALGHVNNAVYLTYLEVARQSYWRAVAADVEYDRVPFVVARAEIDFRSPTRLGEVLRVGTGTTWVSRSSFGMDAVMRERDSGRLVVEARTVLVAYDYDARRAMPVPGWLRAGLERAEGRALPGKGR